MRKASARSHGATLQIGVGATLGASDGARGRVRCMPLLGVLVAHNCALPALALKTRTFDAGKNLERQVGRAARLVHQAIQRCVVVPRIVVEGD